MEKGFDYVGVTICYFCHDGEGNFLMNLRSKNCRDEWNRWDIGARGLEFGDSVENTLRKEIKEEYCTDVLDFEFMGFRELHREHNGKKTHWIGLDYKVRVDRSKVANGEPHKFTDVQWFTLENLPSPTHSQFPVFLEKNKKILFSK
jgi:8-oxo-dGTP pyrophosphatase MutT (NUDIX family)